MRSLKEDRTYLLPVRRSCRYNCEYCSAVGFRVGRDKSATAIARSLRKAATAEYDSVAMPCNIPSRDIIALLRQEPLARGMRGKAIVNAEYTWSDYTSALSIAKASDLRTIVVIGSIPDDLARKLAAAEISATVDEYWLVIQRDLDPLEVVRRAPPTSLARMRFYFPDPDGSDGRFLNTAEMFTLGETLRHELPQLPFRPPGGVETHEKRIAEETELEPLPDVIRLVEVSEEPVLSVVVPSYRPGSWLTTVLRSVATQRELGKTHALEILVVADGECGAVIDAARAAFEGFRGATAVVNLHRSRDTDLAEQGFRAGVTRNVGARHARGEYLLFLDDDMLVPDNLIAGILQPLREGAVVQGRRIHLTGEASRHIRAFSDVTPDDTYVADDGYWDRFYRDADRSGWSALEHPYKYICSHSLAMSRTLFRRLGGFRKTFPGYGFEDTELGYRLWKDGNRFQLSAEHSYHYEPTERANRGSTFDAERDRALAATARKFYHFTLDPNVYRHFEFMFSADRR